MKKALLVFALVAFLATGTVFAELTGVGEPTVSGSVSTTFGYDLDDEASGFVNDSSLTLTLPLLDGSMTKGGDDGMYGEITVEDLAVELWDDGFYDVSEDDDGLDASALSASISAKLVMNDFFVKLGEPDFSINNVDVDDGYIVDANADDLAATGGMAVGFMNDLVTVEFQIASEEDYYGAKDDVAAAAEQVGAQPFTNQIDATDAESYTPNVDHNYVFGAALTLTPMEGVSVPVSFMYDAASTAAVEDHMAFGAAPSVTMAPLTFKLPIDYVTYGETSGFEMNPSVQYDLITDGSNVSADFLYGTYTDVVVNGTAITGDVMEVNFAFTETEENGFVPNLYAMLEVAATNLGDYDGTGPDDVTPIDIDAEASYNMNGLKPYINGGYNMATAVADLGVGVEMASAFTGLDNTVMTLDYSSGAISDGEGYTGDTSGNTEKGRVTFDVTVSF